MEHKRKNIKDIEVITNCDNLDATPIENRIFTVRGHQIMVDRDLAELYGVDTRSLNQAVKRNIGRFPESFRFQISDEEKTELVANCDRFKTTIKFSPANPYVFTEQGVAMLSAVLKSETAIHTSIRIIERPRQKAIRILQDGCYNRHRTTLKAIAATDGKDICKQLFKRSATH